MVLAVSYDHAAIATVAIADSSGRPTNRRANQRHAAEHRPGAPRRPTIERQPMISCPTVKKESIRWHYNISTPFYRLLWGPHIHHGLWEKDESPRLAQVRLTERLADLANIKAG